MEAIKAGPKLKRVIAKRRTCSTQSKQAKVFLFTGLKKYCTAKCQIKSQATHMCTMTHNKQAILGHSTGLNNSVLVPKPRGRKRSLPNSMAKGA